VEQVAGSSWNTRPNAVEYAVKGIAMLTRQATGTKGVKITDGQMVEAIECHQFVKTSDSFTPDIQLP